MTAFWTALHRLCAIGAMGILALVAVLVTCDPNPARDALVTVLHLAVDVGLFAVLGVYVMERCK